MRIAIENLTKRFGSLAAVNAVSLSIAQGELFTLLGPSGCGKTTLLRLIAGFNAPDEGEIRFGDRLINAVPPHERGIGMVFQNYALWPHMTVGKNVAYGLKLRKVPAAELSRRVQDVLAKVGLAAKRGLPANRLSYGERRALEIAVALACQPRILFLDEPTSGLGAEGTARLADLLRELRRTYTMVVIEHDMRFLFGLADRISVIHWGQVIAEGTPDELRENPWIRASQLGTAA